MKHKIGISRKDVGWIAMIMLWFAVSVAIGFFLIHTLFPNAPFSVGPEAAPVMMPAGIVAIVIGMGIFGLGFVVAFWRDFK